MLNIQGCISYYTQAKEKYDQTLDRANDSCSCGLINVHTGEKSLYTPIKAQQHITYSTGREEYYDSSGRPINESGEVITHEQNGNFPTLRVYSKILSPLSGLFALTGSVVCGSTTCIPCAVTFVAFELPPYAICVNNMVKDRFCHQGYQSIPNIATTSTEEK